MRVKIDTLLSLLKKEHYYHGLHYNVKTEVLEIKKAYKINISPRIDKLFNQGNIKPSNILYFKKNNESLDDSRIRKNV